MGGQGNCRKAPEFIQDTKPWLKATKKCPEVFEDISQKDQGNAFLHAFFIEGYAFLHGPQKIKTLELKRQTNH